MLRTPELDVHVHLFPAGTWDVRRHPVFAGSLRRNREDRAAYESLRRTPIARDWATTNDYAEAKVDLIGQIAGGPRRGRRRRGGRPTTGERVGCGPRTSHR